MKKYDTLTFAEYSSMSKEEKAKISKIQLLAMLDREQEATKASLVTDNKNEDIQDEEPELVVEQEAATQQEDEDEIQDESSIGEQINALVPLDTETKNALIEVGKEYALQVSNFAKANPGTTALVTTSIGALAGYAVSNGSAGKLAGALNPMNLASSILKTLTGGEDKKQLPAPDKIMFDGIKNEMTLPEGVILPDKDAAARYGGQAEVLRNEDVVKIRDAILDTKYKEAEKMGGEYEIIEVEDYTSTPAGYKKNTVTENFTCPDGSVRKIILGYRFKKIGH